VIKAATSGSIQTSPGEPRSADRLDAPQGAEGNLRKEFDKFLEWAVSQPRPDVVALPYTLLIALAKPLREALGLPHSLRVAGRGPVSRRLAGALANAEPAA
jgi:hypothetical protein